MFDPNWCAGLLAMLALVHLSSASFVDLVYGWNQQCGACVVGPAQCEPLSLDVQQVYSALNDLVRTMDAFDCTRNFLTVIGVSSCAFPVHLQGSADPRGPELSSCTASCVAESVTALSQCSSSWTAGGGLANRACRSG